MSLVLWLYTCNGRDERRFASVRSRPDGTGGLPSRSVLLVLHLGEFGVHDVAFSLLRFASARGLLLRRARFCLLLGLRIRIDLLAELLRCLRERLRLRLDLFLVLGLENALGILHRSFDFLLFAGIELVAVLLERLL